MNEQKQATPSEELHRQFMDHSTPLNEAGHWARRRIEQLESELRRQATDLHEGEHKVSDFNEPVTEAEWWAKGRIEQLEADRENLLQLLESASEVIGRFVSDEGWAQSDMDMMDTIDAEIVRMRRAAQ